MSSDFPTLTSSLYSTLTANTNSLSLLSPYHKSSSSIVGQELTEDKPRKRIRQRVDAGLPRNAYSKNNNIYPNLSAIMNPTWKQLGEHQHQVGKGENSNQHHLITNQLFQTTSYPENASRNFASYISNAYLQSFLRLQQLRQQQFIQQSFLCDNRSLGETKSNVLDNVDDRDDDENENEVARKRVKFNNNNDVVNSSTIPLQSEQTVNSNISDISGASSAPSTPSNHSEPVVDQPTAIDNNDEQQTSPVEEPGSDHSKSTVSKSEEVSEELKDLAVKLKSELMQSLSDAVDKIVSQYLDDERSGLLTGVESTTDNNSLDVAHSTALLTPPLVGVANPQMMLAPAQSTYQSIFPYRATGAMACLNVLANKNKNTVPDTPLSLLLGRKRRTKVTDSRVNRLSLKQDQSPLHFNGFSSPFGYPTMVSNQTLLPNWNRDEMEFGGSGSPENNSDINMFETNKLQSTTLSPIHLRKAKLIFFYARYPTSAMLKAFFPDIRFHKNNTAQLVKWFSNFREFFYIQMEKYARQALAEGVKNAEDINVSVECDLYKCLTQHYNRNNNHIQIPSTFCHVIEATLREFFVSLQNNRDLEPSWKKSIYKVIARLDEPIPEYFKTANFLEQLQ